MHVVKAQYVDVIESEGARVYTFRASTGAVDRQNEIVDQAGWSLDSYRQNPVVLDSHKYDSIEDVIGRAVRVEVVGDALEADIIFADTEKGECAEELVNTGFLRTVSVGFRSLARRPGGAGQPLTHTQAELLEISLVAVPANREAVRIRSADEGDEPQKKDVDDLVGNNSGAIEAKAGRVISSANLEKLRSAIDAIQAVIDAAGMEEPVVKPMAEPEPEGYKADAGVLNALTRFVGGNNGQ
jgi:HK97 family phage prohead protease